MLISARTRKGVKRFRRAGFALTSTPQTIEVDEEQFKALNDEPMIRIFEVDEDSDYDGFDSDNDSGDSSDNVLPTESELGRLNKSDLLNVAAYFKIEVDPDETKAQIVATMLAPPKDEDEDED